MGKAGGAKLNSGNYSKALAEKHRARGGHCWQGRVWGSSWKLTPSQQRGKWRLPRGRDCISRLGRPHSAGESWRLTIITVCLEHRPSASCSDLDWRLLSTSPGGLLGRPLEEQGLGSPSENCPQHQEDWRFGRSFPPPCSMRLSPLLARWPLISFQPTASHLQMEKHRAMWAERAGPGHKLADFHSAVAPAPSTF